MYLYMPRVEEQENMGWFLRERRGPAWKQGWGERTLASVSPPPLPLLAIFLIIFILLHASTYFTFKNQMHNSVVSFKIFLLFLPVLLILVAQFTYNCESFFFHNTKAQYGSDNRSRDLPWGVAVLVVVLLVLVSYQPSFQAMWSPIVRRPA